jgi:hypothetical protein
MQITDQTVISEQSAIISAFSSNLTIKDTVFTNISLSEPSITITSSQMTIESSSATNISMKGSTENPFIITSLNSVVSVNQFEYTSNTIPMMTALSTALQLDSLEISNINSQGYMLSIIEW